MQRLRSSVAAKGKRPAGRRQRVCNFGPPNLCNLRPPPTGDNPFRWKGTLEHVLPRPSKVRKVTHHAALPWQEVPAFMAELRKVGGMGARALEFAILTAARSGEVRFATWDEIDLDAKLWT